MIAIDPGPTQSAWLQYNPLADHPVRNMGIEDNEAVLQRLYHRTGLDNPVVIEMVASYGMSVGKDVFETVYWIGRFSEAVGGAERIYRKDVKMALCGDNRAKDANIRQALIDLFGGDGGKQVAVGTKDDPGPLYGFKSHLWQALALAVTYERLYL